MEFKKSFKLELGDYTTFNFFAFRKLFIFVPILAIILTFVFPIYGTTARKIVIALATAAFAPLGFFFLINYSAKKTFRTTRLMHLPQEIILNDTGVHTSGELGTTNITWQYILKVSETKNAVYIFVQKTQAIIIPKRIITEEEAATIRTLIMKNLPPEKNQLRAL